MRLYDLGERPASAGGYSYGSLTRKRRADKAERRLRILKLRYPKVAKRRQRIAVGDSPRKL